MVQRGLAVGLAVLAATVMAAQAGEQRIGIYENNPAYFAMDGAPVFLVGATYPHGWTPISRPEIDYMRTMDRLAEEVGRAESDNVRGVLRCLPYDPLNHLHDGDITEVIQPWRRVDDEGRYDLGEFEPEWEERLRHYLGAAQERGFVVALEVWDDWSVTRGENGAWDPGEGAAWNGHPFNPDNNVNYGEDVLPSTTQGCNAPFYQSLPEKDHIEQALEYQHAYVDHLLGIVADYPNVLLTLSNETRADLAWSRYWAEYIGDRTTRLVGEMPSTNRQDGGGECDYDLNPLTLSTDPLYDYVDIAQGVSRHEFGTDPVAQAVGGAERIQTYFDAMNEAGAVKPLLVIKDYTNDQQNGPIVHWSRFLAGAASSRFHRSGEDEPEQRVDAQFRTAGSLAWLAGRIPFWEMAPQHDVIEDAPGDTQALALAKPGECYVVQFMDASAGEVQLAAEQGTYTLRWVDPATADAIGEPETVEAPADEPLTLQLPEGHDHFVAWLAAVDAS